MMKVSRDARTGRFVTAEYAEANPATTTTETITTIMVHQDSATYSALHVQATRRDLDAEGYAHLLLLAALKDYL
jgi:hypothetical protein